MVASLLALSTGGIIGIAVAAAVVIAVVIWIIVCRNGFVRLSNTVDEAWATIDVQLKKRYDLIPNVVATVKGYASHEKDTLEAVVQARNAAMSASGKGKAEAENALSGTLKTLFALQEAYPQLKADAGFLDLQRQLSDVETELAAARRYYNGAVKSYNTKLGLFPSNLIARLMGLTKRDYFELTSTQEAQTPVVTF